MAGARDRVRMDDAEVAAFLADASDRLAKLQVATLGPDGQPHLTTLFYVVLEGRVTFWTYATSQKVRNLERDDRITVLVEDGSAYEELRGVSLRGRAEVVRDTDAVARIGTAVLGRMLGLEREPDSADDLGEDGRGMVAAQAAKRVGIVVHPERTASWDHRKA